MPQQERGISLRKEQGVALSIGQGDSASSVEQELSREEIRKVISGMSREEKIQVRGMSPEERNAFFTSQSRPETFHQPGTSIETLNNAERAVAAVQQGLMPAFNLPFGEAAGFGARMLSGLAKGEERKLEVLRSNGFNAEPLPTGQIVIINGDNTVSLLEEEDFSSGDFADATGAIAPAVGATLGGAAGGATVLGAAAGTAGGAMAGQSLNELLLTLAGSPGGGFAERSKNVFEEGLLAGGGTLAVGGAGKLFLHLSKSPTMRGIIAPFEKQIDPDAQKMIPFFEREGINPSLPTLSESRLLAIMRTASGRTLAGADRVGNEDKLMRRGMEEVMKKFNNRVYPNAQGLTLEDAGLFAKQGYETASERFHNEAARRFAELESILGDQKAVPIRAVQYLARKLRERGLMDKSGRLRGIDPQASGDRPAMTTPGIAKLQQQYLELINGKFTYTDLKGIRTLVREATPNRNDPVATGPTTIFKGLHKALTDDLLATADHVGIQTGNTNLRQRVADTNKWYAETLELLNGNAGKILADHDAQKIMGKLFVKNNIKQLRDAQKILPGDEFDFLANRWLDDSFKKAMNQNNELSPGILATQIEKLDDATLEIVFKDKVDDLLEIKDALKVIQTGIGRGNLNPQETAAVGNMLWMMANPLHAGVQLVPGFLSSRAVTSEGGKQLLTEGVSLTQSPLVKGVLRHLIRPTTSAVGATADALRVPAGAASTLMNDFDQIVQPEE